MLLCHQPATIPLQPTNIWLTLLTTVRHSQAAVPKTEASFLRTGLCWCAAAAAQHASAAIAFRTMTASVKALSVSLLVTMVRSIKLTIVCRISSKGELKSLHASSRRAGLRFLRTSRTPAMACRASTCRQSLATQPLQQPSMT